MHEMKVFMWLVYDETSHASTSCCLKRVGGAVAVGSLTLFNVRLMRRTVTAFHNRLTPSSRLQQPAQVSID